MPLMNQKVLNLAVRGNIDARTLNINGTAVDGTEVGTLGFAISADLGGVEVSTIDVEGIQSGRTTTISVPAYANASVAAAAATIQLNANGLFAGSRCVKFISAINNGVEITTGVAVLDGTLITVGAGLDIAGNVTAFTGAAPGGWAPFDMVYELA